MHAARLVPLLAALAAACSAPPKRRASAPEPEPAPSFTAGAPSGSASPAAAGCIVVGEDLTSPRQTTSLEGVLRSRAPRSGKASLVLELRPPRCVVGFPRARYVTEVWVASTGA